MNKIIINLSFLSNRLYNVLQGILFLLKDVKEEAYMTFINISKIME